MRCAWTFLLCHWAAATECEKDLAAASSLIQKQLLVHQRVEAVEAVHPWDKHIFVVGTHHKSGSQLLRNTMAHFFNLLGATMSCQYHGQGPSVTLLNRENDCEVFPAPIRFHNHITAAAIQHMRQEASEGSADLRGVMILRDPMEMVISAYVYHHRGAEPNSPFEVGIANMGPEEGVPEMAKRMLPTIQDLAAAHQVCAPEIMEVHYESITGSSAGFDANVENILNTLFPNELTELQKAEIRVATQVEDLNRASGLGLSWTTMGQAMEVNHTNDDDEMRMARAAIPLIPTDLYEQIQEARKQLGYA